MITQEELGQRLRTLRLELGLTQEEVAEQLDLPRPAISQIEAGKRGVDGVELAKLSRLYRRPLSSLFGEDSELASPQDALTVLFRATDLQPEDQRVVENFERLCAAYGSLEEMLDMEQEVSLPDYSSLEPRGKLDAIRQGEQVALEERRRLGIGDDPVRDVFSLLESQGIRLFVRPLQTAAISGLFLYDREIGPCILVNAAEHHHRIAFSAAHEYGHVLLDRKLMARASAEDRMLGEGGQRGELLEVRAHAFAAAFLLPAAGIERFLGSRGRSRRDRQALDVVDVLYLQRAFGVSYQAALFRLQNFGWLDRTRREKLAQVHPDVLARTLGLADEQEDERRAALERRYPLRYLYLALEAFRRAKISLPKLAQLLDQSIDETTKLVRSLGLEAN